MKVRVGLGYDVHKLVKDRDLWIGGVNIPHEKGALGHSDADVLLHVICDALLGAADLRDIGFHFPDTDPKYKNVDSKLLLKEVIRLIREKGFDVGNIDSTVCLQRPKLALYIPEMKKVIAELCGIEQGDVSIKATTTERLGFVGKEEGISAYAVVLIQA